MDSEIFIFDCSNILERMIVLQFSLPLPCSFGWNTEIKCQIFKILPFQNFGELSWGKANCESKLCKRKKQTVKETHEYLNLFANFSWMHSYKKVFGKSGVNHPYYTAGKMRCRGPRWAGAKKQASISLKAALSLLQNRQDAGYRCRNQSTSEC